MKKILVACSLAILVCSCGGATDGDAKTDTTTMPVDTALYKTNANTTNKPTGTTIADSTGRDSTFTDQ
jgi:hypothetical protein